MCSPQASGTPLTFHLSIHCDGCRRQHSVRWSAASPHLTARSVTGAVCRASGTGCRCGMHAHVVCCATCSGHVLVCWGVPQQVVPAYIAAQFFTSGCCCDFNNVLGDPIQGHHLICVYIFVYTSHLAPALKLEAAGGFGSLRLCCCCHAPTLLWHPYAHAPPGRPGVIRVPGHRQPA